MILTTVFPAVLNAHTQFSFVAVLVGSELKEASQKIMIMVEES